MSNHREVHDETEFCSTLNRRSVGIVTVRVRCEPCSPYRQSKTVSPNTDGRDHERTSEGTSHTSSERANSLSGRRNEKDWSAMRETESARSRSDKRDSLLHYCNHCVGDLRAGFRTVVGVLAPSYPAVTVSQEHTIISPQYDRGDEYRDWLAAPKAEGCGSRLKAEV